MNQPVIILGGGDHAKVLINALRASSIKMLGVIDKDPARHNTFIMSVPVLGDDSVLDRHRPESVLLVNGIGSINVSHNRAMVYESFKKKGYSFISVLHPSTVVASGVILGEGAQIMAGAIIQPGSRIGANAIINTHVTVDHDCEIGDHVHLAPGVTLSGCVRVGSKTHIGTGAIIIQGISIGMNCMVAAGAVVVSDVPNGLFVAGLPAREIRP